MSGQVDVELAGQKAVEMSDQKAKEVAPCSQEILQGEQPVNGNVENSRPEYRSQIWERYIQDFLVGSDHVTEAAIIEKDSGKYLASSSGFKLSTDEYDQILAGLSNAKLAYRNGVTINDRYYKTRLADGSRGIFALTSSEGCSICKTNSLVIIGVHDEKCIPRQCNEEVMTLGDYFVSKGM